MQAREQVRDAKDRVREARLAASDARLRLKLAKNDARRRRMHAHRHSETSHHVDSCGLACRLGLKHHPHRDAKERRAA